MSTYSRLCIPFLSLLLIVGTSAAQQSSAANPPPASRITIDAVVTDRSGEAIAGLQQQDFTLTDNKAGRPINSFRALGHSQEPVEVVLVIDTVNASYHTVSYERTEIDKFLHAEGSQLAYPTSLAIVTDTGTQATNGFSTDGNQVSAALDKYTVALRTINRSTGIYGADERFTLSLTALQTVAAKVSSFPGRKIILWISPGWPLLSGPHIELSDHQQQQIFGNIVGLSTQLRKSHITLYSVDPIGAGENLMRTNYYKNFLKGIEKPSQVDAGDLALQVIATQTGGLALDSSNDTAALLRRCYSDANSYYELSFDAPPADRPNEYHHLQLQVNRPDVSVRTIQGYYNQLATQTGSGTPQ
jgi:VWFA-related protein